MTLASIKAALARGGGIDPDALFAAFRAETGSEDPDRFLAHLRERGVLDEASFRELQEREQVDATETLYAPPPESTARPGSARETVSRARYELIGTAGTGGMGTVHVAKDLDLLRRVALKRLAPDMAGDTPMRGRFVKEARITAQLDHPHIVPVYSLEVGADGTPGYTMKLVQGKTFHELVGETRRAHEAGRLPDAAHSLAARLEHFVKVCDAMAYAHGKGVIHRDLKPPNLMLGRYNEVYVMDWGICALVHGNATPADEVVEIVAGSASAATPLDATSLGAVVGTPRYMAPEQAARRSAELDPRSDQYSLGLILFELVSLRRPIEGERLVDVLQNAAAGRKAAFTHAFRERIPIELRAIVGKATATAVEDRYATVGELADDLRRHLRGEAVRARPDAIWQKVSRAMARHRVATLAGIAVAVLASALLVLGTLYERQRALDAEMHNALRLAELSAAVSGVGDRIQTHLLTVASELTGFASAIELTLTHGEPTGARSYVLADFKDPARAPSDLGTKPGYPGKISLEEPVWLAAPGVPAATLSASVLRLSGLRSLYKGMFGDLRAALARDSSFSARRRPNPTTAVPLVETMLGLENGVAAIYPGSDAIRDDYDARGRPWYKLAVGQRDARWGRPYRTSVGALPALPCSVPLLRENGELLGVASALLSFDYLIGALLEMPDAPSVRETFLLDDEGSVVVQWPRGRDLDEPKPGDVEGLVTPPFPDARVREALRGGRSGTIAASVDGRAVTYAFDSIDPFGWGFVAAADTTELLRPDDRPAR